MTHERHGRQTEGVEQFGVVQHEIEEVLEMLEPLRTPRSSVPRGDHPVTLGEGVQDRVPDQPSGPGQEDPRLTPASGEIPE